MAALEEILREINDTEEYMLVSGYECDERYTDSNYILVTDRQIGEITGQVATAGEENAQYMVFKIDRYHDGIDILTATLGIYYEISNGDGGDNAPINVMANSKYVLIGWLIPKAATHSAGQLKFILYARGENYKFKTLTKVYQIENTLDIGSAISEPDKSWYEKFVSNMENYISTASAAAESAEENLQRVSELAAQVAENEKYVQANTNIVERDVEDAARSAEAARTAAAEATVASTAAQTAATEAESAASNAASDANQASTAVTNATNAAQTAQTAANTASNASTAATKSASSAAESATAAASDAEKARSCAEVAKAEMETKIANYFEQHPESRTTVSRTVVLEAASWHIDGDAYMQSVQVMGISADEAAQEIHIAPAISSMGAYVAAEIYATEQHEDEIVFTASEQPTEDITVHVIFRNLY